MFIEDRTKLEPNRKGLTAETIHTMAQGGQEPYTLPASLVEYIKRIDPTTFAVQDFAKVNAIKRLLMDELGESYYDLVFNYFLIIGQLTK